jgi:hypothetical protein
MSPHTATQPISVLPSAHTLPAQERAALMRAEWAKESRFQKEFGNDTASFASGVFSEALREQVLRQLRHRKVITTNVKLEELHLHIPQELKDYGMDDGVNLLSTYLYDTDAEFTAHYLRFVKECIGGHFPYPFYFQATPTVRIHCPDGKNSNHYPRYHTDIGYGHPPQEINLWLPLTEPQGGQRHGFRLASVANSRRILEAFGYDFTPFINRAVNDPAYNQSLHALAPQVDTPFGRCFAFDARCIHTGEPLISHTRASIDVRIIPVEDFNALTLAYQGTGRRKALYAPGEAYYHLPSNQL